MPRMIVVAEFEDEAAEVVQIWSPEFRNGPYSAFKGEEMKQKNLDPDAMIRYLAHQLQNANHKLAAASRDANRYRVVRDIKDWSRNMTDAKTPEEFDVAVDNKEKL